MAGSSSMCDIPMLELCLAREYDAKDQFGDAEVMYKRAYRGIVEAEGCKHRRALLTAAELIAFYEKVHQGQLKKAVALFKSSGLEDAVVLNKWWALEAAQNVGILYRTNNQFDKAEALLKTAIQGFVHSLGLEHKLTLDAIDDLGILYIEQGRPDEAMAQFQQAKQGYEKKFGTKHRATLRAVYQIGDVYEYQGQLMEAEDMYQRALEGFKELGDDEASAVNSSLALLKRKRAKEERRRKAAEEVKRKGAEEARREVVEEAKRKKARVETTSPRKRARSMEPESRLTVHDGTAIHSRQQSCPL